MIAITSKSALKTSAVINVVNKLNISLHRDRTYFFENCESEINEQPYGIEETLLGAENRIKNMKSKLLSKNLEYSLIVSIENGIIPAGDYYIDLAVVVIEMNDGTRSVSTSCGVMFPKDDVEEARNRGFYLNTAGSVIAERIGCPSNDPHSALTGQIFNRKSLLEEAVKLCFSQILQQ